MSRTLRDSSPGARDQGALDAQNGLIVIETNGNCKCPPPWNGGQGGNASACIPTPEQSAEFALPRPPLAQDRRETVGVISQREA